MPPKSKSRPSTRRISKREENVEQQSAIDTQGSVAIALEQSPVLQATDKQLTLIEEETTHTEKSTEFESQNETLEEEQPTVLKQEEIKLVETDSAVSVDEEAKPSQQCLNQEEQQSYDNNQPLPDSNDTQLLSEEKDVLHKDTVSMPQPLEIKKDSLISQNIAVDEPQDKVSEPELGFLDVQVSALDIHEPQPLDNKQESVLGQEFELAPGEQESVLDKETISEHPPVDSEQANTDRNSAIVIGKQEPYQHTVGEPTEEQRPALDQDKPQQIHSEQLTQNIIASEEEPELDQDAHNIKEEYMVNQAIVSIEQESILSHDNKVPSEQDADNNTQPILNHQESIHNQDTVSELPGEQESVFDQEKAHLDPEKQESQLVSNKLVNHDILDSHSDFNKNKQYEPEHLSLEQHLKEEPTIAKEASLDNTFNSNTEEHVDKTDIVSTEPVDTTEPEYHNNATVLHEQQVSQSSHIDTVDESSTTIPTESVSVYQNTCNSSESLIDKDIYQSKEIQKPEIYKHNEPSNNSLGKLFLYTKSRINVKT